MRGPSGPRSIPIVLAVSLIPIAAACQRQVARAASPRASSPTWQGAAAYDRDLTLFRGQPSEHTGRIFQPDLAKAYAVQSAVRPLTFSFGYHWETGSSTVMLALRKRTS